MGAADFFTGGATIPAHASMAASDLARIGGGGAGAASQSAAQNRGVMAALLRDAAADREDQLLQREAEKRTAQSDAYKKAMLADFLGNWRPANRPGGVPTISFTDGPSGEARDVSSVLFNQARGRLNLDDLQNPTGMPQYQALMDDPRFTKLLSPSKWEKTGGIMSILGPMLGSVLEGVGNSTGSGGGGYQDAGDFFGQFSRPSGYQQAEDFFGKYSNRA